MSPGYSGQILLTLFCLMAVPSPGFSQRSVPDLSEMSLEDLMNIEVTSVSRKEQRAIGTAVSIDVTGYGGLYTHLRTVEPAAPIVEFVPSARILVASHVSNLLEATTRGVAKIALFLKSFPAQARRRHRPRSRPSGPGSA